MTDTIPHGGNSSVIAGTFIPPDTWMAWPPELKVAIKMLEGPDDDAEESIKSFKSLVHELSLMERLSHPNVIRLVGFVEDEQKGQAWLIVPWEANGNVREFLHSGEWDIPERVSLIKDVVNGLEYLHTREPPICHGDLKSLNILVNSSYRAVISDFGSARTRRNGKAAEEEDPSELPLQIPVEVKDVDEPSGSTSPKVELDATTSDLTLTGPGYTVRWAAPELLRGGVQDLPSDMWAIGWICWEIVTGTMPFEGLNDVDILVTYTLKGEMPPIRDNAQMSHVLQLCGLMSDCWLLEAPERIDVSTFCRKVRFVPSITPSATTLGNEKLRSANLLVELGRMYGLQNNTEVAAFHYQSAHEVAVRTDNAMAEGDALLGLAEIHIAQSRYSEAEKAFREAYQIYSRIGNYLGVGNAVIGLGDIYDVRSKYLEAENAFKEAQEIFSGINDEPDFGFANALIGLGGIYDAQSMYPEAEKAFSEACEIHSRIGNDLGAANAQIGLGRIYNARSRYSEAEKAFKEAYEIHSRIGNEFGAANALMGQGEIYDAQSKYSEAEQVIVEAHEIHSRIGSDLGAANAQIGLGRIYNARSRYSEGEKAFGKAYQLHRRIGNDPGTANTLIGLGETYSARWRYQDAEKALMEAHEIHSRIGNDLGAANALTGLGAIYDAQLKYSEAEQVLVEAHEIHSRIGSELGAANALIGLGDMYNARSRYTEAETAFVGASEIYSRIGNQVKAANAGIRLGETYNTQSKYPEADDAFKNALGILSGVENILNLESASKNPEEDCDTQSGYSGDEGVEGNHSRIRRNTEGANALDDLEHTHLLPSMDSDAQKGLERAQANSGIGRGTEIEYSPNDPDQGSTSAPPYTAPSPTFLHDASNLPHLSSQRTNDDPASPPMPPVADTQPDSNRQEQALPEELTRTAYASAPATKELIGLLEALGKAALKAVRNKHKIYSILRVSRDICNRVVEIGDPHERQSNPNPKALLTRTEDYCTLLDALEETLLQLAVILPSEITAFGVDSYSSWLHSRSTLAEIQSKLCRPPFPTISSHVQDIPNDLFFDDCSWLSRLLYGGIHPEIATQFPDVPTTHPVVAVINGLEYLETQGKCGVPDEPTRELIIDITTFLAQTLARASPEDDDDESVQENSSPSAEADRDWLVQALADSFSILHLDSTLQPSTAKELATKWTNVKIAFTSRGPNAPGN